MAIRLEGNSQLFLAGLKAKTVIALTADGQDVTAFDVRDSNHFVYAIRSPAIGKKGLERNQAISIVGTGLLFEDVTFPVDSINARSDLFELWAVVDGKRSRVENKLTGHPIFLHSEGRQSLTLSPDGRFAVSALAVTTIPSDWEERYPPALPAYGIKAGGQKLDGFYGQRYVSEFVLINLLNGDVKPLTGAPTGASGAWGASQAVDWSSNGRSVVLSSTFIPSEAQDSEGKFNRPCVAVIDLMNGHMTCLEQLKRQAKTQNGYEDNYHFINNVGFERGSSDRVMVHYSYLEAGHWSKASKSYVSSVNGSWATVATENGWRGAGQEQDLSIEIEIKESFAEPPVLIATDKTTKTSRVILDPNPQLEDVDLGEASIFTWKDKNGRTWAGGLYKPPGFIPGQRHPLVVQTHGFYQGEFNPSGVFPTGFAARELAGAGILVLQVPDCPYTVSSEEGPCNAASYEAAIEQLVADGLVDENRVGIIGFSRSCYYVLDTLTTTKVQFKAASITDGIDEGYLQYITSVDTPGNGMAHEAEAIIGARPFGEGLQQWLRRSPAFNMDKVKAPLQVVAIGRLGVISMWEQYAALRFLNKPVDLIVLREGTHILTNPAERMVSQGGTVDWFRFWLKGEEDPDPTKAEQYARWRDLLEQQEGNRKTRTRPIAP